MGRSRKPRSRYSYKYLHPHEESEKKPIENNVFMDTATGLMLLSQPKIKLRYKEVREIINIYQR